MTTSVAVQAASARSTSSIGPGALFDARSESMVIAWPDGLVATNFSSPIHLTDAVCMRPPQESIAGRGTRNERRRMPLAFESFFSLKCGAGPVVSIAFGEESAMHISISKTRRWLAMAGLGLAALVWSLTLGAGARLGTMAAEGEEKPYVIEYESKPEWGRAEEF